MREQGGGRLRKTMGLPRDLADSYSAVAAEMAMRRISTSGARGASSNRRDGRVEPAAFRLPPSARPILPRSRSASFVVVGYACLAPPHAIPPTPAGTTYQYGFQVTFPLIHLTTSTKRQIP